MELTKSSNFQAAAGGGMVMLSQDNLFNMMKEAGKVAANEMYQMLLKEKNLLDKDMSSDEAAVYMGMKKDSLLRLAKVNNIPYRKGRPNYYKKSDLDKLKELLSVGRNWMKVAA